MSERSGINKLTFGVAVMSFSVILTKICGMFFKIPLTSILGTYGMGVFNTAYTVYSLLFVLCSAGLPSAIAISVSSNLEANPNKEKRADPSQILSVSVRFFGAVGFGFAVITYVTADLLARLLNNPQSAMSLKALSACVLFTCISGVFRGYFQGHKDMVPTAISQVTEALGKLIFGVCFALYASKKGFPVGSVAAYAVFGVTLSSLLSMLYLLIKYAFFKHRKSFLAKNETVDNKIVLKKIFKTAAPITMSSLVMSVVGIIDLVLVMRLLKSPDGSFGFANDQYGTYSALAVPLFNLPSVLIMPIATAALPVIAGAVSSDAVKKVQETVLYAVKLCTSIAVPSALGLCFLSEPILMLLFEDSAAIKAAPMLSALSSAVVFMCLLSVQNPILQGEGLPTLPMVSMLFGATVKVLIGIVLIPRLGIYACAIGTFGCFSTASLINGFFIERKTGLEIPYLRYFLHALVCAIPATALSYMINRSLWEITDPRISCFVAVCSCALIYFALIIISGFFKIRDITHVLHIKRRVPRK